MRAIDDRGPAARAGADAWASLTALALPAGELAREDFEGLPEPARRLLAAALPLGTPLVSSVVLEMEGEIRVKRWMPFTARQVVRAGIGFRWEAEAGSKLLRISGADTFLDGMGSMAFKLWGLVPVVKASGPDVDRSAAGRLAIETAAWLPHALLPRLGTTWRPVDDSTAVAHLPVGIDRFDVQVCVDERGLLSDVMIERWGDPDGKKFAWHAFGGGFDHHATFQGVTIPTSGRVGWWWGTPRQSEGEFFRYEITKAEFQ